MWFAQNISQLSYASFKSFLAKQNQLNFPFLDPFVFFFLGGGDFPKNRAL